MYKTIVAAIFSLLSSLGIYVSDGGTDERDTREPDMSYMYELPDSIIEPFAYVNAIRTEKNKKNEHIFDELIGHKLPDLSYLLDRAQCETGINWRNGGKYSGAFGAYRGTWQMWGGYEEFGVYNAYEGTRDQQVLIWYRVHYTGYHSPTKGFIPPAGPLINNCSEYAGDIKWVTVTEDTVPIWRYIISQVGRG
jgi:hypothetical protein